MVLVNIQYKYGFIRLEMNITDSMQNVLKRIANRIHVNPKFLSLYSDHNFQKRINDRSNVLNARISNKQTIYLKCTCKIPPPSNYCKFTEKRDIYKDYLNDDDPISREDQRIVNEFGTNAVTSNMIERHNSRKPHVEFQPESSCYAFRVGTECLKRFREIAFLSNFSTHRIGFLYGRVDEIKGKVTAHVLMEPPQENYEDRVILLNEAVLKDALQIASFFGMSCVGMVISHLPNEKLPMTSYMVEMAAYYQNLYGEYFTTLVVTPEGQNNIQIEAFQVSDAGMQISIEGFFNLDYNDPQNCYFNDDVYVCHEKKRECPANIFLCAVRIRETHSKFISHQFPSLAQNPNRRDVFLYLQDFECTPTWYRLFDFNLLLYLFESNILTIDEIEKSVDCILTMTDIPNNIWSKIEKCEE